MLIYTSSTLPPTIPGPHIKDFCMNITTASVIQHELTGFMAGYEYNITVRGVKCESQEGNESEPLTIRPQGILIVGNEGQVFKSLRY